MMPKVTMKELDEEALSKIIGGATVIVPYEEITREQLKSLAKLGIEAETDVDNKKVTLRLRK